MTFPTTPQTYQTYHDYSPPPTSCVNSGDSTINSTSSLVDQSPEQKWHGQDTAYRPLSDGYCTFQNTQSLECPCDPKDYHRQGIVGYDYTYNDDPRVSFIFSHENIKHLSHNITKALRGVDPQGRDIVVTDNRIVEVLSSVFWDSTRERVGSIYSRYIVPDCLPRNDIETFNLITMNIIVSAVKDEYDTIASNKRLTIWTTVLGDFNTDGLRAHPPLKIRKKFPQRMMFNMNY